MPPKGKTELLNLEKFSVTQLSELQGKKEEIKAVIEANPIIVITDTETYEAAKKSRTTVKTLRTSLEKEKADVKRKIKEKILDVVDNEYSTLVSDVKIQETLRQDSVDVWEAEIEKRRLEKIRLEQERVDGIKKILSDYSDEWKGKFTNLVFADIETVSSEFYESYTNFDATVLKEFEPLFPKKVEELTEVLNLKTNSLTESENTRLEKIRLANEAEELARKNAEIEAKQEAIRKSEAVAQSERDKFAKEKANFELEKQKEQKKSEHQLKVDGRIQQLVELGLKFDFQDTFVGHDFFVAVLDIKTYDDEKWVKLISKIETKISTPVEEVIPEVVDVKNIEVVTEPVNESLVEKLIPIEDKQNLADLKEMQKEASWDNIFNDFKLSGEKSLSAWLKTNYNVPTKIN